LVGDACSIHAFERPKRFGLPLVWSNLRQVDENARLDIAPQRIRALSLTEPSVLPASYSELEVQGSKNMMQAFKSAFGGAETPPFFGAYAAGTFLRLDRQEIQYCNNGLLYEPFDLVAGDCLKWQPCRETCRRQFR